MCGRTALALDPDEIRFKMGGIPWYDQQLYHPCYNVAPSHYQPVVLHKDASKGIECIAKNETRNICGPNEALELNKNEFNAPGEEKMADCLESMSNIGKKLKIKTMKWGLLPTWGAFKGPNPVVPINIRDDSLTIKNTPMFNRLKNSNRCCVLAQGFFEWKKIGRGKSAQRIPYFSHLPDNSEQPLMMLGALYDQIKLNGQTIFSYAIITTQATDEFSDIHDRMPLIFDPIMDQDKILRWLSPRFPFNDAIKPIIATYSSPLVTYEVPIEVNHVANNDSCFIKPVLSTQVISFKTEKKPSQTLDSFFTVTKRERTEDVVSSGFRKITSPTRNKASKTHHAQSENATKKEKEAIKIEPECIVLDSD